MGLEGTVLADKEAKGHEGAIVGMFRVTIEARLVLL